MTDYLGPLTLGSTSSGTYQLVSWSPGSGTVDCEVVVRGASVSALSSATEALIGELRQDNIWAHTFPGASSPVVYAVQAVSGLTWDEETGPLGLWTLVKATLSLSPAAGAVQTLYSAEHVDSPASLSLAGLYGTVPTPLDVTVDDDSGNDLHCLLCALAPAALSDAKWLIMADDVSWTTLTAGTGSDCWGNVCGTTTSASYQTAPLDTAQYPAGKYRLYVRAKQSAGTGYVMDSQNSSAVAVTRTSQHLTVVGDVDLPARGSAPGTAANLTLSVKSDGTNTFTLNAFVLIPLYLGSFSWHSDVVTGECDQVDVGPSGLFVDGLTDTTYLKGGVLTARTLATHVPTQVGTASPTGSTWPTDWGRTDASAVTAASSKFHIETSTSSKWAWYAATNAATPLVARGVWYELTLTRQVTARSAGTFDCFLVWQDVDGTTIRTDTAFSVSATDASPVSVAYYAQAPVHAARCQVLFGGSAASTVTADVSAVVLRRSPLRLIVVAEDAAGTLSSNVQAVHVTLRHTPRYEVSR